MIHVFREDGFEMAAAEEEEPSRHSRRMVPTNRSATAFARSALTGVMMIWISWAVKTVSKDEVKLVSRSRIKDLTGAVRSASSW